MKITRKQLLKSALAASVTAAAGLRTFKRVSAAPAANGDLSSQRVAAIAALLPEAPRGFGPPCRGDRRAEWDAMRARPAFAEAVSRAEKLLTEPFPAWDDALYLQFSQKGIRPPGEKMMSARHAFLAPLVYAECLENRGRFVPRIEEVLHEYATEKTWTLPAHDADLKSFHGTDYFVDLGASSFAGELAQALYLLDGVISPSVRAEVMAALETRIFAPMRTAYRTGKGPWWMTADMNWNAVCLAGTTFAALAVLPTRQERAFFAAGGERYSRHYLDGYQADGYCKEGLGYYDYGFGHYIVLRETLWQATGGKVDLFLDPKVRQIATYGPRLEIENGAWPAIGDCRFGTQVDEWILGYCSRALGLGLAVYEKQDYAKPGALVRGCLDAFPNSLAHPIPGAAASPIGIRSDFERSGLLVVRPAAGSACRLAAALLFGNNDKPHNHNDVGSFTLVLGKEPLVGDPGGPYAYTNKTFSQERYTAFKLFASYGHPVPLLGDVQQRPGPGTDARVLSTDFTDAADILALDIAAAYPPGAVTKLVRTFRYSRIGAGSLVVEDEFTYPAGGVKPFEIGLTTHGDWKQTAPDTLTFTHGGETVAATVAVPDGAGGFTLTHEVIEENCVPFTRLGLRLNQPTAAGQVTVTFRPLTS